MNALNTTNRVEFTDLQTAESFVNQSVKINMIVLGDNGKFWVMLPKYSEVLVKNYGFEYAK